MPMFGAFKWSTGTTAIRIESPRFTVEIDRACGLIRRLQLGGTSWVTPNDPVPDLWVSPSIDPLGDEFRARFENQAETVIEDADGEHVVVLARGRFYRVAGQTLPVVWSLRYRVGQDGRIRVAFSLDAERPTALRWVVASAGILVPGRGSLLIWERGEEADGFGLDTQVVDLDEENPFPLHGENVPWFQVARDDASIDVVFSEMSAETVAWTDTAVHAEGDPLGRSRGGVHWKRSGDGIHWQRYRIRNTHQWVVPGQGIHDQFDLGLQPVRLDAPTHDLLSAYWEGPHQFVHGYRSPGADEVAEWAAAGVELVIGGVNWPSGDYAHPANLDDARGFIARCHQHGIKVLPYVTLHDLEYTAPVSVDNDQDWRIEPIVEFNYRSHLMCTGAQGWREHWQEAITRALDRLDLDGLYIDFWAGKLLCYNPRHGCSGRRGRYQAASAGDLLAYAARQLTERKGKSLIIANTSVLPLAAINQAVDVRLVGEGRHIERIPPKILRAFYQPARFGNSQLVLVDQVETLSPTTVAMSIATSSALTVRKRVPRRTPEEIAYWEHYRGALGELIKSAHPDLCGWATVHRLDLPDRFFVNVYRTPTALVLACANLTDSDYAVATDVLQIWGRRLDPEFRPPTGVRIYAEAPGEAYAVEEQAWPMTAPRLIPTGSWALFALA